MNDNNAIWGNTLETGLDKNELKNKVTSVNNKTGAVKLTAANVGAATEQFVKDAIAAIDLPTGDEWKYAGKFTTEEAVNPFVITEDIEGNPLEFTNLFLRVNLRWFQLPTNGTNKGIGLLGDDNKWYDISLNGITALKMTKSENIEDAKLSSSDVTPLLLEKIDDYLYLRGLADQNNSADSTTSGLSVVGNKGVACPSISRFKGIRFSLGNVTNLVVAGSNVEVFYK